MVNDWTLRTLVIEGDRAIALTHYRVQPPNGAPAFDNDEAEAFIVRGQTISDFKICFDSAPCPK